MFKSIEQPLKATINSKLMIPIFKALLNLNHQQSFQINLFSYCKIAQSRI